MATRKAATSVKEIKLLPIMEQSMQVTIVGTSLLCLHNFSQKQRQQVADRQQGLSGGNTRAPKDIKDEWEGAFYLDNQGRPCVPAVCLKNALIFSGHKDKGITKVDIRGGIWVDGVDGDKENLTIRGDVEPFNAETYDVVRLPSGTMDLRWRPKFPEWELTAMIRFDPNKITIEQLLTLLYEAGRISGLCENRPQKTAKAWGMFAPDPTSLLITEARNIMGDVNAMIKAARARMLKSA